MRTLSMDRSSERRRMTNPRKAYPVDPGLISLFERSGRHHRGMALETVVILDLERQGYDLAYVRNRDGFEVDVIARRDGEVPVDGTADRRRSGAVGW